MTEEKRVISEPFTWSKESELENRLKEAEEVIGFYAEIGHWGIGSAGENISIDPSDQYDPYDRGYTDSYSIRGGKRAREYFKKYGGSR